MQLNAVNAVYGEDSRITLHTDNGPVDVLALTKTARDLQGGARRRHLDDLPGADGELRAGDHHRHQMVEQLQLHPR